MTAVQWGRRVILGLLTLVLLASCAVAAAVWWSLPSRDLQARLPGLSAPVAITLDADGIPFIVAKTELDAAAALGFMHARDRMFQMELMRRAASGRLSELVGPATLRLDRTMRTLGLRRRAEADSLDPATRSLLDAYARGVNAWIDRRGRFAAPEFIVLGTPEPWTAVDSLLWGKTMALYLAGNWRLELDRASLAPRLSSDLRRALWPDWAGTPRPDAALAGASRLAALIPAFPAPFTLPATASNEWAVDGSHSVTGAPLLAGDPHLALTFPSIWYLARIQTPEQTLAGATAPGVPFLVLGHNGHVAWTFTTTGADTEDIFVETPLDHGTYATPDGPMPFVTRDERIAVRGAPDDVVTVRETRHGPVLSDLDPERGPVLAVAMASLQAPDTAAAGLRALNRAATLDEAGMAATAISAPVQNLLVADRSRIGLFTSGRVPLRRSGDGAVPVDGADGAHDWTGFAAGADLPRIVDPPGGRLVNANERTVPPDFPVFMGSTGFGDWRARRIRALLDARSKHDVASFAAMQVDVGSSFAQQILPALLATTPADDAAAQALTLLRGWDGSMAADRPEPLLFNAWVRRFFAVMMEGLGLKNAPVGPAMDVVGQALSPGGAALCGGDCAPLLARSLAETTPGLGGQWGTVHRTAFAHPLLGRLPVIGALFTWSMPQPGDDSTIFRGSPRTPGWESVHGPGFRGAYDLSDLDRSLFGIAPGQSGHPFSRDAAATLQRWHDGTPIRLGPQPDGAHGNIALMP